MRFYNVEMKGKFKLSPLSALPSHDASDEGRLMYYNNSVYFSDSTSQVKIAGSGPVGNASCLDGQPGSYYLCRDNHTGCNDADLLEGQAGSYYTDGANATGILPVEHGGTGGCDTTGVVTALGLDDRYGQLDSNNVWTGSNTICNNDIIMCGTNIGTFCWRPSSFAPSVNISCGPGPIMSIGTWNSGECGLFVSASQDNVSAIRGQTARVGAVAVWGYHCTSNPARIGIGVCAHSDYGHGLSACSSASSFVCCYGVYARSNGAAAVAGNTAYCNLSSRNLKHLNNICLSNCVRETPLNVYRYYWEDSNNFGFFESIGPVAEDFNKTFNVNHIEDGKEYEGLWTVDGAALGLSLENLKEIDKVKNTLVKMYSCIQDLQTQINELTTDVNQVRQ